MRNKIFIQQLKRQNAKAQKKLYNQYSSRFLALCIRYLKDKPRAEDVLMEGFMKIFKEVKNYRDIGSFEAWMYRIMVNQCLMEIRKNKNLTLHLKPEMNASFTFHNALDELYEEDLMKLISQLPSGCRTVFNLFIIEGYSHKEISKMLNINEGTSKSQLNLAKNKLKEMLSSESKNQQHGR